jgi:hypothetical protein
MPVKRILTLSAVVLFAFAAVACSSDDSADSNSGRSTTSKAQTSGDDDTDGDETDDPSTPGASLPTDWPDELALPEGSAIVTASQGSGISAMAVVADLPNGSANDAFDTMKSQLTEADYEIVGSTFSPSDQGGYGSISARGSEYTVAIAIGPNPTGKKSQMSINVATVG